MDGLPKTFGQIDIYLFDQLLRGRIRPGDRILEAGCGGGRNLHYLLASGYPVWAVDADAAAVEAVRALAGRLAPTLPPGHFRNEPVEAITFQDGEMDVVISIAVLHFARDEEHFAAMLLSMWRVLRPGGLLFCRLASNIGMEHRMIPLGSRRHRMPDGSERFLADEDFLLGWTARLGGELLDPLKTTVVQDQRCMTTWVARKAG